MHTFALHLLTAILTDS